MESSLPTHAKDNPNISADGAPSKNALKKAQKDAEKAAKKAAAKAKEAETRAAQQAEAGEDTAVENYGDVSKSKETEITHLKDLSEEMADKQVTVIVRIHNSRSQSAKLAFLMLRQQGKTIQAVVAAGGDAVSKQMVKWCAGINVNSFVKVFGVIKKPSPPVASATGLQPRAPRQ